MTTLVDVPENDICQRVKNLILAGWRKIMLEKQPDGNWTITAE